MSEPKSVVFWQNVPSIHQSPLIATVARRVPVVVLLEKGLPEYRRQAGWEWPDFGDARVLSIIEGLSTDLLNEVPTPCIHVFSGLGAYPLVLSALHAVTRHRLKVNSQHIVCVQLEGVDSRAIKGKARLARLLSWTSRYGGRVDRFLLIGRHAERQFAKLPSIGQRSSSFAYYSDSRVFAQAVDNNRVDGKGTNLRLLYLGRLAEEKRVDILLDAVARSKNVTLDVYGDGKLLPRLQQRAQSSGQRVRWHGSISHSDVPRIMGMHDALCLPSDYDGWGVPVNEALLAGLPVLVSDGVGSSVVVEQDPLFGEVFPRGNVLALTHALEASFAQSEAERPERARRAASLLGAEAGASRLLELAT